MSMERVSPPLNFLRNVACERVAQAGQAGRTGRRRAHAYLNSRSHALTLFGDTTSKQLRTCRAPTRACSSGMACQHGAPRRVRKRRAQWRANDARLVQRLPQAGVVGEDATASRPCAKQPAHAVALVRLQHGSGPRRQQRKAARGPAAVARRQPSDLQQALTYSAASGLLATAWQRVARAPLTRTPSTLI